MHSYMDILEELFLSKINWNINDSYSNITLASKSILDFSIPDGTKLNISSKTTNNTFTNYTIQGKQALTGSISYIFSSKDINLEPSNLIPLPKIVQCFRKYPLTSVNTTSKGGSMLFGRMHLPKRQLESMAIFKLGGKHVFNTKFVVDNTLKNPVIFTSNFQSVSANNKLTYEILFSSHEKLIGGCALYRLASWDEANKSSSLVGGMELFLASAKKSPGASIGLKYSSVLGNFTLPIAATLVLNPIVGGVSASYTLKPTYLSAFSSRFDFNFYSYISDLTVGCELWRNKPISLSSNNTDVKREGPVSVLKASTSLGSQTFKLLWEGSLRDFLVSAGVKVCYGDIALPVTAGLEFTYSS